MDFKERILTTLNHEEPDRVPVMGLIVDPATVNQVLGTRTADFIGLMQKPALGSLIMALMNTNRLFNRFYYSVGAGALRSAIKLGFDANWTIYSLMKLHRDPRASEGLAWHDVFGRVWDVSRAPDGSMAVNYSRALCDTEEKWEAWVEDKAPQFEKAIQNATAFHKKLVDEYGDRVFPVGYAAPGIFENCWQPIGFVNFTRYVYERPEFVKRVIDFHTDFYLRYLEGVMESGVKMVLGGDDLGQKTGPMMRPEQIDKLFGESYRRVSEFVHKRDAKLIWHSCGNIYQLLDSFIEWGFDGIITLEPTAGMELGRVREQVGHKLVLVGNIDVSYLLVRGSREEVDDAVRKAIGDAAKGGGYILSSSHSHPHVDGTRLGWMVEAAHKYGRYPIAV